MFLAAGNYCIPSGFFLFFETRKTAITLQEQSPKNCPPRRWQMLKQRLNNLSPEEFARRLEQEPAYILLDVRKPEEYQRGHLPRARNINYLSPTLWEELEQLPKDRPIFVYCQTERRSLRVCTLLQNGGYDKVYHLDGGLGKSYLAPR